MALIKYSIIFLGIILLICCKSQYSYNEKRLSIKASEYLHDEPINSKIFEFIISSHELAPDSLLFYYKQLHNPIGKSVELANYWFKNGDTRKAMHLIKEYPVSKQRLLELDLILLSKINKRYYHADLDSLCICKLVDAFANDQLVRNNQLSTHDPILSISRTYGCKNSSLVEKYSISDVDFQNRMLLDSLWMKDKLPNYSNSSLAPVHTMFETLIMHGDSSYMERIVKITKKMTIENKISINTSLDVNAKKLLSFNKLNGYRRFTRIILNNNEINESAMLFDMVTFIKFLRSNPRYTFIIFYNSLDKKMKIEYLIQIKNAMIKAGSLEENRIQIESTSIEVLKNFNLGIYFKLKS